MGLDYALVHLCFNIPPAVLLSLAYYPLVTALDIYKVLFLVIIAVLATLPWDSYLIRNNVWSYPPDAIIGPKLFSIPAEEVFFFVIQTYNTSLIYLFLSKPLFHPVYLEFGARQGRLASKKWLGASVLFALIAAGWYMVVTHSTGFYLGLILVWACPFALLLWLLAYQYLLSLPLTSTFVPIAVPTLYLWAVDTLSLNRGTWVIEMGTKLGLQVWKGLEIEEAFFFVATNTMIVFGLVAFDNAVAVLETHPHLFPASTAIPHPLSLIRALFLPTTQYDHRRIEALTQALQRLRKKSRSFYLASAMFTGRLRADLILLYSFYRVGDDLVDEAATPEQAERWIAALRAFVAARFGGKDAEPEAAVLRRFPGPAAVALASLPSEGLSREPFDDLLRGFAADARFLRRAFPIADRAALERYAAQVAGTVAESCIELCVHHAHEPLAPAVRERVRAAGRTMGRALQLVNVARDVGVDARTLGRVYLPTAWLVERGLTPEDVLADPDRPAVAELRQRLLDLAFEFYAEARPAIELLPSAARAPMRVAVESYMEIGRALRRPGHQVRHGRATVPLWRRLYVAWVALCK